MSNDRTFSNGVSLFRYGPETLVLESTDGVVSASLEPVRILSVDRGVAITGLKHAADYLDLHVNTIRRYADNGKLKARKHPSGVRRIEVDSLKELHSKMYRDIGETGLDDQRSILAHDSTVNGSRTQEALDSQPSPIENTEDKPSQDAYFSLGRVSGGATIELKSIPIITEPPEGYTGITLDDIYAVTGNPSGETVIWVRTPESQLRESHSEVLAMRVESKPDMTFMDGAVSIDLNKKNLILDGRIVSLSIKDFEILNYLAVNEGISLTRDQILGTVWGPEPWFGSDNIVDIHISSIRKALGDYRRLIRTIYGYGYVFDDKAPPKEKNKN